MASALIPQEGDCPHLCSKTGVAGELPEVRQLETSLPRPAS